MLIGCVFKQLLGLGYDSSTADDAIRSNANYISDLNAIGSVNTTVTSYNLTRLAFVNIS